MIKSLHLPPSSSGPGRGPLKAKTGVRVPLGASIYLTDNFSCCTAIDWNSKYLRETPTRLGCGILKRKKVFMKSPEPLGRQLNNNAGGQGNSPASARLSTSRGYLIALTATVLLSFTGIMISYLIRQFTLPSLVVAFWRALFVSLGLFALFGVIQPKLLRINRSHWLFMLLFGLTLATFNSAWTFSVQFNGAAIGTVLAYSSPAFTALISRWLLSEKMT